MTLETYLLYLGALAVFFATPPDTSQLLIIANSARHGLKKSGRTIVGDLTANVLRMSAAAFGIAAVISASATVFQAVKWLGVAYLAWIGLRLIFSRPRASKGTATSAASPRSLLRQGFITSSANPFAVMFFAALFPQFIDPAAPTLPQLTILGATYLIVDCIILLAWGSFAAVAAARLQTRALGLINRICGTLMLGAAFLLADKDLELRHSR